MLYDFLARIEKTVHDGLEDLSALGKMFALLSAFLAPLHSMVGIMLFFLFADTLSAIFLRYKKLKEKKCKGDARSAEKRLNCMALFWNVIDPEKLHKTVEKLFAYPAIALVCFVFDKAVVGIDPAEGGIVGKLSVTNMCFALICFTDFKSFLRNMGKATGNSIYEVIEKHLLSRYKNNNGNQS